MQRAPSCSTLEAAPYPASSGYTSVARAQAGHCGPGVITVISAVECGRRRPDHELHELEICHGRRRRHTVRDQIATTLILVSMLAAFARAGIGVYCFVVVVSIKAMMDSIMI